jgi:two-component system nitrate/nitrite response regulator NarL
VAVRCLIVDDSAEFIASATRLLESQGIDVVGGASSSHEALALTAALLPDVALVDIELGDESGLSLAESLAAHAPSVHVVLISAWEQIELADLIADGPAIGFITKRALGAMAIWDLLS